MTKEKLQARKAEAEQHKTQLIAQVNMTQGIVGECDYWLSQIEDKPAKEKKKRV